MESMYYHIVKQKKLLEDEVKEMEQEMQQDIMEKIQQDVMEEMQKNMSDLLAEQIDREMLDALNDIADDSIKKVADGTLSDTKVKIDPEYLHNIKMKVEKVLEKITEHYELEDYLSDNYRNRVSPQKWHETIYYKLYEEMKDIDGKTLKYGHEYVPTSFDDWKETYLKDYMDAELIYDSMCINKRVVKEDLIVLNKLAKKYKVATK